MMTAKLSPEEKNKRKALFGTLRDGLRPLKPYQWRLGDETLIEIPVTTMPLLRTPFHLSYLAYLSGYSTALAMGYFRACVRLCQLTRTQPSLLLHAHDFLGCNDARDLSFFPGMNIPHEKKLDFAGRVIDLLVGEFTVVNLLQHSQEAARAVDLPFREPGSQQSSLPLGEHSV
jgi:hypothetical protein